MKELLRRILRGIALSALRLRSRRYTPDFRDRCMILAPHQDDETFGCAGVIIACRKAAISVDAVYITDGAGSHPEHPRLRPPEIAELRRTEAILAMSRLGLPAAALHFLDAPDGKLSHLAASAAEALSGRIAEQIRTLKPSVLFIPYRDDGSSEHAASFKLALRALRLANLNPRILEYPVWARWSPQRLIRPCVKSRHVWRLAFPGAIAIKQGAISAYASQVAPTPPWTHPVLPAGFVDCFDSSEEFFFEE